jgi:hypothetical protein
LDIATKKRQYFWSIGLYTKKAGFNDRFSGTRDGIQLFYEIYRTVSTPKVRSPIGGLVSKYFYNAYCAINRWDRLGITIKYLLWRYPDYKVWVTGHSLGGALASIAAGELVEIQKIPSDRVITMTFGQPRVGNAEYVEAYNKLVSIFIPFTCYFRIHFSYQTHIELCIQMI